MQPRIAVGVLAIVAAVSFVVGYSVRGTGASAVSGVRKPLYYHDPMHPSYRSDKPGIAPDCGMQLEPVYADSPAPRAVDAPGTLRISFEKQQMMGLKTEPVGPSSGMHTVRVLGRVAADESRVHRVSALVEGVIRSTSPYAVGNVVPKDAVLAVFFVASRDLYRDFQSYFTAMGNLDRVADANPNAEKAQVRMREELLKTYGVTEAQLADVAKSGQVTRDIEFRSPVNGLCYRAMRLPASAWIRALSCSASPKSGECGSWRISSKMRADWCGRGCPRECATRGERTTPWWARRGSSTRLPAH